MNGDPGGGFFTPARTGPVAGPPVPPSPMSPGAAGVPMGHHLASPPPDPASRIAHAQEDRSPFLGILACMLVAAGVAVTALGGNQGGLVGMPILLLGALLGAIAAGRNLGRTWGIAAAMSLPALAALAVLSEILRIF